MGQFETASPGISAPQAPGEAAEDAEAAELRYPEPPARSYGLGELLRMAGYDEQVGRGAGGTGERAVASCLPVGAAPAAAPVGIAVQGRQQGWAVDQTPDVATA